MRIQSTKYNTLNFSSNWQIFCHDDEISKQRRKYIREHLEEQFKDDEIRNSGRLSEYELNQLIKSLVLAKPELKSKPEKNPETYEEILLTAGLYNLQSLYGDNSYRAALGGITQKQVQIAKQAGIKHIVDLRDWTSDVRCDGVSYYHFSIRNLHNRTCVRMTECEFLKNELKYEPPNHRANKEKELIKEFYQQDVKDFCGDFVKFIQTMQKKNVLIGCECGTHDTNFALWLNKFFNPQAKIMVGGMDGYYGPEIKRIYELLSQKDKKAMGWDEEFDKNFIKRLEKYGFWID